VKRSSQREYSDDGHNIIDSKGDEKMGHIHSDSMKENVFIALGSNIGDRSAALIDALQRLRSLGDVVSTSFLYETQPMYVTDQPSFLNAACLLRTSLPPLQLLKELKSVEDIVGRRKTFRNGPRVIDLDIIMYGNQTINAPDLIVPHLRLHERGFVLKPLNDIAPHLFHPLKNQTIEQLLSALPIDDVSGMRRVVPLGGRKINSSSSSSLSSSSSSNSSSIEGAKMIDMTKQVLICGILNVTPDSFSDGGKYNNVEGAVERAMIMLVEGADMIDIGGESTRPGATPVSVDEELRRILPVIKAIRERGAAGARALISVDTRNATVAAAAISAGADIVNDVSGGLHDPQMLPTVASLGVPIVIMHMRGTPETMSSPQFCDYTETGGVLDTVARELKERFDAADLAGTPRWMQLCDPGIGFAKDEEGNLSLMTANAIKALKQLLDDRPLMLGVSRKRTLTSVLTKNLARRNIISSSTDSVDIDTRDAATIGACSVGILGGADILRVHNVKMVRAAADVVKCLLDRQQK